DPSHDLKMPEIGNRLAQSFCPCHHRAPAGICMQEINFPSAFASAYFRPERISTRCRLSSMFIENRLPSRSIASTASACLRRNSWEVEHNSHAVARLFKSESTP